MPKMNERMKTDHHRICLIMHHVRILYIGEEHQNTYIKQFIRKRTFHAGTTKPILTW